MPNVTLIGEKQAVVGKEFLYLGPLPDCRDCKVRTVCFNLEAGRLYRIMEVRSTPQHECKIHEGRARAIEFEKVPLKRLVPVEAVENSPETHEYDGGGCRLAGCEHHALCRPLGVQKGEKYKIVSRGGEVDCPLGRKLRLIGME